MKDKPGFCHDFFLNQAFWNYSDCSIATMPCSIYKGNTDIDVPADESWNGPNRKKIIMEILNGNKIDACNICYREESAGRISRRQADRQHYEEYLDINEIDVDATGPVSIDYSVGNLCNLKCVICGPNSSTSWIPDYQKLNPTADISKFLYRKDRIIGIKDKKFVKNLKSIHFHGGGEPFLSNNHMDLLRIVKETKGLSDMRVYYNTNATKRVTQEILDLWGECKLVELYFSLDDIGTRFEYQRTGAKWTEILDNLTWFKTKMPNNHLFKINCVYSYLNLYYLDEIYEWHKKFFNSNRFGDPTPLIFQRAIGTYHLEHLSEKTLNILKQKFANKDQLLALLKDILISQDDHDYFWRNIKALDAVRSTDFTKLCPEWSLLLC